MAPRTPAASSLHLRVVRLSGAMFSSGIEEHGADGVVIRVYSAAKTVVDCFRFRNRIGLDVAREALVDSLAQHKATLDDIWNFARVCRMARGHAPLSGDGSMSSDGVTKSVHQRLLNIRDDQEYLGIRSRLHGFLGPARLAIQVDAGFGDAVTPAPEPIQYPVILDFPAPRLRAYFRSEPL